MKAAVLNAAPGELEIEDIDIDSPGRREVLVATRAAGLCHSDLHFMEGTYRHECPTVLGHESAGVVLAVGDDVGSISPGDHVITCLSAFCGHCRYCISGRLSLCEKKDGELRRRPDAPPRLSRNGGERVHTFLHLSSFAEQMLVHEQAVVRISQDMPLEKAALIGCAVTTGLGAVFRTARVEPGSTVAVIGCGGIGLSAVQGARIAGANRIVAVDLIPLKLDLALALGATHVVNGAEDDPVDAVMDLTEGRGVDYSFEAVGRKDTAEQSFAMLSRGGQATVIGLIPPGINLEIEGGELFYEKTLTGSNMGSNRFPVDMPRFVQMYLDGRLRLDEMVSQSLPLERINHGFQDMKSGAVARSVILFD